MKKFFMMMAGSMLMLLGAMQLCAADFTLESGDYKVVIGDRKEKLSVAQIFYKGCELGTRTGFYASVLAPQSGKYIGAGHNEGGQEKILSTSLTVDGKETAIEGKTYKGEKLVFVKTAMLAAVELKSTLTLTPEGLKEDREFKATEDQPLHSFYLFQYCLNKKSTDYLFFRTDGSKVEGKFVNDKKMRVAGEKNAYSFCQFFPEFKLGIINFKANFGPLKGSNLLWDQLAYHKYYFWADLPKVLKKGYTAPKSEMIVRAFPAEDRAAWVAEAEKLNAQLLKEYPLATRAARQEPLRGTTFELQGQPKFNVQKIALDLEPGANYQLSFALCKKGEFNPKVSDHCTVLGGYDAQKKFHPLVTLGAQQKADGEWHTLRYVFKAPAHETFLYVYNTRNTGLLSLKDLVLEKQ